MKGRGFAAILAIALASVMLIASGGAGAQSGNEFVCTGTTISNNATAQNCEITASTGKCIEHSTSPVIVQTCTVNQTGPSNNEVVVDQANNSSEQGESTQDAAQITTITQQGTSNRADVNQDIRQTTHDSGGGTQKQDGHQTTVICQGGNPCTTTNTGTNTANVTQSRWADAHASGGDITQLQDTVPGANCTVGKPNLCAQVTQNSTTRNDVTLNQEDHLLAEASGTGSITQTQGSGDDGIDGHAIQFQTLTVKPQNTENTHQHLTYDLSAPDTATQMQDPRISGGTPGGKFNLHQVGILRASATDAVEHLSINGDCVSTATCLILQHGKINGANFTTRCQGEASCSANIECHSEPVVEGPPEGCTGFPAKGNPPEEDLASLGFDTLDFQNAINFTFPVSLPLGL
jgi:hypothetical protein